MTFPKELPVPLRAASLACLLVFAQAGAAARAAAPSAAGENVTYAYAPVLRVTPVYGVAPAAAPGQRRVIAYDVEYQYKGDTFMSRLERDPGSRLRIRIAITPVETGDAVR